MTNRLVGIDVARALAIMGMIIVNFKIAFGENGNEVYKLFASLFEGKAAATFVLLAGVGIAFISNNAIRNNDELKLIRYKRFGVSYCFFFSELYSTNFSQLILPLSSQNSIVNSFVNLFKI
ncbi:MAG: DUF1624 domain-containing protein [Melioribacteraceae bacterium]|nr:DUF1624 domain-containing protein [Melioribacteraceae bacterium]